jgi:prophage DNA circulation protein
MNQATWRQQLQRASFRGVPFYVKSADTEEGRRGVLHEYPLRDDPYVEDMGRKAGEFSLEAFVVGDDYFKARDALRAALKQPGPGELIHPTLGRMQVSLVASYRFVESLVDEGGVARFSLRFTESQPNQQPTADTNTAAVVDAQADAAMGQCCAEFDDTFSLDGLPEFAAADAMALLTDATKAIEAARAGLMPDLTVVGEFSGAVSRFTSSLSSLIMAPVTLANQVFGLTAGLRAALLRPASAVTALFKFFNRESTRPPIPATTPNRRTQAANRTAIEALVRRSAVIEAARAAARVDFAAPVTAGAPRIAYQQAVALREQLADALEDEAATGSVATFSALMDLRAAVVRDITARGADLPRLVAISMPATLPALVVAYLAFGDATRAAEIVARNAIIIRHPGFVPGGIPLEALA